MYFSGQKFIQCLSYADESSFLIRNSNKESFFFPAGLEFLLHCVSLCAKVSFLVCVCGYLELLRIGFQRGTKAQCSSVERLEDGPAW